ncbi:MAG: tetratricopeptide repeat protein [Actinobacteria bacterium]|nr:tetratricopeptide repeat protein [Actinomycetota bacterium]
MHKRTDALSSLLSATGPFWRGRNLRRFLFVLIPFALACVFTFKILSSQWFSFNPASYASWSLGGSFLFPVSIFQLPIQVIILGLLLGLIIVVSILSAQSFGLAPAVFFVACVFWLAHLPMMALVLLAAIFLAGNPALLSRSRFYSALLGLVPVTTYLFLAVWIVLAGADPTYVDGRSLTKGPLADAVAYMVSPMAICLLLPIFMLLGFIAGLPVMLWRRRSYLYLFILAAIGVYVTASVLVSLQASGYASSLTAHSLAESVWPEMSSAGQASRQDFANLSPIQQSWMYAPVLLAICLALISLPVLLWLVHWRGKPAVTLALTTILAGLVALILFYTAVGRETLEYMILKGRFEPNSSLLRNFSGIEEYKLLLEQYRLAADPSVQLQSEHKRAEMLDLLHRTSRTDRKTELQEQIRYLESQLRHARQPGRSAAVSRRMEVLLGWIISQFEHRVATAEQACRRFLKTYPHSRHRPHVLYIYASVLDALMDQVRLRRDGSVYVYYRFPSAQSKAIWQELLKEYPENVLACPGGLSLARLLGREGCFEEALQVLDQAYEIGRTFLDSPSSGRSGGFATTRLGLPPTEPVSTEQISGTLRQIRQLTELIESNYRDPIYGSEPLRRFLTRDSQASDYIEDIEDIRAEFPDSLVAESIWLQVILVQPPARQLSLLQSAVEEFAGRDAGRDALFYLAQLEMSLAGEDPANDHLRYQAAEHFRKFLKSYPQSYQAPLVREQLARLSLLSAPAQ